MANENHAMSRFDRRSSQEEFLPQPSLHRRQDEKQHSVVMISAVVAFYFVISLSVVFLNKIIMSGANFPYALFMTWYQLLVALVILLICSHFGKRSLSIIPPYEFDTAVAKKVAPLTIMYVMMLALNNLCLKYVEVTFYQVARSLSINFSIIFTYLILGKKTSFAAIMACVIVFFGFAIGSYGEINFSWAGMIYGVGSSAFVALYGIYVKKTLSVVDDNEWRLLHYNTTLAIFFLFPILVFSGELTEIAMYSYDVITDSSFWLLMTVTGITGFGINIAMFLQVKYTSALTNTICGTAKACLQTALAAMVFQNPVSGLNALGIMLALFGSGYYGWVRYKERFTK